MDVFLKPKASFDPSQLFDQGETLILTITGLQPEDFDRVDFTWVSDIDPNPKSVILERILLDTDAATPPGGVFEGDTVVEVDGLFFLDPRLVDFRGAETSTTVDITYRSGQGGASLCEGIVTLPVDVFLKPKASFDPSQLFDQGETLILTITGLQPEDFDRVDFTWVSDIDPNPKSVILERGTLQFTQVEIGGAKTLGITLVVTRGSCSSDPFTVSVEVPSEDDGGVGILPGGETGRTPGGGVIAGPDVGEDTVVGTTGSEVGTRPGGGVIVGPDVGEDTVVSIPGGEVVTRPGGGVIAGPDIGEDTVVGIPGGEVGVRPGDEGVTGLRIETERVAGDRGLDPEAEALLNERGEGYRERLNALAAEDNNLANTKSFAQASRFLSIDVSTPIADVVRQYEEVMATLRPAFMRASDERGPVFASVIETVTHSLFDRLVAGGSKAPDVVSIQVDRLAQAGVDLSALKTNWQADALKTVGLAENVDSHLALLNPPE